ncbi:MAG: hypothetical protein LBV50_03470 [Novosphingobium sp.]|jgi:hypothetical protein|nr:hypothetical protein [Novosphingobium sp.]
MTGVFALTPPPVAFGEPAATRQALTTGMSFRDALRMAGHGTNRMFAFDELGMFGYIAATRTASLSAAVPSLPASRTGADGAEGAAVALPLAARPADDGAMADARAAPESKGSPATVQTLPPGHYPDRLPCSAAGGRASAHDGMVWADGCEPAHGAAASVRMPPRPGMSASARLAVMVADDQAHVVARAFALTESDRALLEKRIDDLLKSRGLVRATLMLNGRSETLRPAGQRED